jgi:putative peptidoglycan lipid II flippase
LGIYGLAWGAVLGAVLHLLVQVPGLIYFKLQWLPNLYVKNPALVRVAILMAPRMLDLLMARIVIDVFNRSLASTLGPGRVSALEYASGLMRMPWTLIGTAIGITIFPTMAALAAEKDVQAQRGALSGSLRAILTLTIPAAVGLVILGRPLIKVLLEGGEFTSESTNIAYAALQFLSVALISQSVLEVVVRSFAAQEDTWTPLLVSFFTTALNVGLAYLFVAPLGISGLPLANGLAVGVEAITGIIILHRRWGGVDARRILVHTGKAVIAAGAMAASLLGLRSVVDAPPLVILVTGGGLGAVTYFAVALLLGLDEIRTVPLALLRHIIPARRRGEASV